MTIPNISPERARQLLDDGAVLIDVREPDEHARERIPQAKLAPLSTLGLDALPAHEATKVVFHCRSGNRTRLHADKLAAAAECDVYLLDGGIEAWKRAGLPVAVDRRQPLELMRQVQIAAGALVLLGAVLGTTFHRGFLGLSAFVGAGLLFAGVTGTCALAQLLKRMPWNRQLAQ